MCIFCLKNRKHWFCYSVSNILEIFGFNAEVIAHLVKYLVDKHETQVLYPDKNTGIVVYTSNHS